MTRARSRLFPLFILFAAIYAGIDLIGYGMSSPPPLERVQLARILLFALALIYGLHRPSNLPVKGLPYWAWLRSTPWTLGKPLPLGSPWLSFRDLAYLALFGIVAHFDASLNALWPIVIFTAAYCVKSVEVFKRDCPAETAGLSIGLGALILAFPNFLAMGLICAAMYGVCVIGFWRYLSRIPKIQSISPGSVAVPGRFASMARLSPLRGFQSITYLRALTVAVQVGWWFFCVASALHVDYAAAMSIASALVIVASLARVSIYKSQCKSPLYLLGRIGSGRLVIPSHDVVYLPSFVAISVVLAIAAAAFDGPPPLVSALAVFAGFLILLGSGPSLRRWALTSECRLPDFPASPARLTR